MAQQDDIQPRAATAEDQAMQDDAVAEVSAAELARRLEEAEAKAREYWDQMLRARADLENERRRFQRELDNAHKYGIERLVTDLLPVRDSLDLGLAATADSADVEKLREGMELTLKMLHTVFEKFGIREIDPLGQRFDPQQHESMASQETSAVEPNTVVTVYQKGYSLNGRLLRPALVVIAKPSGQAMPNIDERA